MRREAPVRTHPTTACPPVQRTLSEMLVFRSADTPEKFKIESAGPSSRQQRLAKIAGGMSGEANGEDCKNG